MARGEVIGLSVPSRVVGLLAAMQEQTPAVVLPVHWMRREKGGRTEIYVVAGDLLPPGVGSAAAEEALARASGDLAAKLAAGVPLEKEAVDH